MIDIKEENATLATAVATRVPYGDPNYEFPNNVENLLTQAQSGHMALSAMADTKASTLMAATFVVFSLTLSQVSTQQITVSMLLLGGFSFMATIFSVLAIKPSLGAPPQSMRPGMNIVFFGAFVGTPEDEFVDKIIDTMKSEEAVYRAMARDLYQNGCNLHAKKYRYLAYAYTTFLIGFGATLIALVWELWQR